jgi:hypothetical protein
MAQTSYFALGFGQPGCSPDSYLGHYAISRRRELADIIRGEIEALELPASLFAEFGIRDLWRHAKRWGLSSISIERGTTTSRGVLMLMGMTEAEYMAAEAEEDF